MLSILSYCLPSFAFFILAASESVDVNLNVDRSNWKDPLDPLAKYSSDLNKLTLEECKKELLIAKKMTA
uniref:Secreted protein n=1 Tax=Syphacia muris TaxID=451379 RepID=A0A0N5ACY2_9BILA